MTFQSWQDYVNGRFIDVDGNKEFWCVDLMRSYLRDCRGLSPWTFPAVLYAKDIFYNFKTNNLFKKVVNTPYNFPQPGDIVFFKWFPFLYGYAGHVAVVTYADVNKLISMDQNYPTKSPCKLTKHSYRGCLGWLHPIIN